MKSLDTNILLYAINEDCAEHEACRNLVQVALKDSSSWIIADQVWFELYRLLRNPSVLKHPLSPEKATASIAWYRDRSGWLRCAWEPEIMATALPFFRDPDFPARRVFDLVLALTLLHNGVTEFATRNTRDFEAFGFATLVNPLA